MIPRKYTYANPAFDNHPAPNADPLPSNSQFQPDPRYQQPLLTEIPSIQSVSMPTDSSNIQSPIRKQVPNRNSTISIEETAKPTSPISPSKKPSRFSTDFNYFKRNSFGPKSPPMFAHRRTFSAEANKPTKRISTFHEHVDTPIEYNNNTRGLDDEIRPVNNIPLETLPGDLGIRYSNGPASQQPGILSPKKLSSKSPTVYNNVHSSDDDSEDETSPPKDAHVPRRSSLGIVILLLCIYSTIGSFLFFLIAVAKPRYGNYVAKNGKLRPASTQLMSAIFAKTIELSFVSVYVAFLGQVLSRRASVKISKGINIAELSMRSWVTQPGSLLTQFSAVKYAGLTFLGALSLTATVFGSLYTTAADTLVSPKLAWGPVMHRNLSSIVKTSYANSNYRSVHCATPISALEDPIADGYSVPLSGATCSEIQSAGNGYSDYGTFLKRWKDFGRNYTTDPQKRPKAPSALDNVSFQGYWIDITGENGLNNVTLAMPHAGVIAAARDEKLNGILQPEQAGSYGSYIVKAAVPNPVVNVLCTSVPEKSVEWLTLPSVNSSAEERRRPRGTPDKALLDLFGWSSNSSFIYNDTGSAPDNQEFPFEAPRFPKLPITHNTVLFNRPSYIDPSVYFLVHPKVEEGDEDFYTLCSIKSYMTSYCSTQFEAFEGSGEISVDCRPDEPMTFRKDAERREPDKPEHWPTINNSTSSRDFKYIGREIANSLSMGTGISNANASISRLLSQLAVRKGGGLLSDKPSLGESLAVLFGNGIVQSSVDSVFSLYYEYLPDKGDKNILNTTQLQYFSADVRVMEYASGAGAGWQPLFYVVLAGVLLSNLFCLIYFSCSRGGFVTDFTEVQNLFCVLMDGGAASPEGRPSKGAGRGWDGSGGIGPNGPQYNVAWWIEESKEGKFYVTDDGIGTALVDSGKLKGNDKIV